MLLQLFDNAAVGEFKDAPGMRRHLGIMRGNDQRGLLFGVQVFKQFDDFTARVRIQVAGRFVGQDQFRFVDEGAGDGDALLFAAGKFKRLVFQRSPRPTRASNSRPRAAARAAGTRATRAGRQTFSSASSSGSR